MKCKVSPGMIVSSLRTFSPHYSLRLNSPTLLVHLLTPMIHLPSITRSRLTYWARSRTRQLTVKEGNEEQIADGDRR